MCAQPRSSPPPTILLPAWPADFVQPESRRNEVLGWVKAGVRDFSISRAAVEWGELRWLAVLVVWSGRIRELSLDCMCGKAAVEGLARSNWRGWQCLLDCCLLRVCDCPCICRHPHPAGPQADCVRLV